MTISLTVSAPSVTQVWEGAPGMFTRDAIRAALRRLQDRNLEADPEHDEVVVISKVDDGTFAWFRVVDGRIDFDLADDAQPIGFMLGGLAAHVLQTLIATRTHATRVFLFVDDEDDLPGVAGEWDYYTKMVSPDAVLRIYAREE